MENTSSPPFVQLITRQLELWAEQRAEFKRQIDEIDRKIAEAAKALGVDLSEALMPEPDLPRLPTHKPHHRSEGSFAQYIRDFMANADRGYTRVELKAALREADPRSAEMINRNENLFYNTVKRLIDRDLSEIDGVLYDKRRAPLDDGLGATPIERWANVTHLKTATDQ